MQVASRREADRLISAGKVLINDVRATLGQRVQEGDKVELLDKRRTGNNGKVYLAYNKPVGIVTTNASAGEKSIEDSIKFRERIFPVGRLDKESEGLIILTNDGRITEPLLDPRFDHEKEYLVEVNKPISEHMANRMEKGVLIEGYKTKPAKVVLENDYVMKVTLTEGKNHQIRRMVTAFGYEVVGLKRIRVMNIKLGDLAPGTYRGISGKEKAVFLKSLGIKE